MHSLSCKILGKLTVFVDLIAAERFSQGLQGFSQSLFKTGLGASWEGFFFWGAR